MVKLKVNGKERTFDGDPNMPLLWYLRDMLGLTPTKFGCGVALCGVCTAHKDRGNGEAGPRSAALEQQLVGIGATAQETLPCLLTIVTRSNHASVVPINRRCK